MDPQEIAGPDKQMREKVERVRRKKEGGATLSREEAGILGAYGAMEAGAHEQREAKREGKLDAFEEEHATRTWTRGDDTRRPQLSDETRREVERIEAKEKRGDTLTRHEAGVLGGAARANDESR